MIDTQPRSPLRTPIALVMDPHPISKEVATLLENHFRVTHCTSVPLTLQALATQSPSILVVSTRFTPTKLIQVLEAVKERSTDRLIPVLLNLDLTQPMITIPGTRWSGKLGIITRDTNQAEFSALIDRLFPHPIW